MKHRGRAGSADGSRSTFAHRSYRRLWAAAPSRIGPTHFNTVALSLLVFDRTGTGLGMAGVVTAEIVPVLLAAPVTGLLVDRVGPVRVSSVSPER